MGGVIIGMFIGVILTLFVLGLCGRFDNDESNPWKN